MNGSPVIFPRIMMSAPCFAEFETESAYDTKRTGIPDFYQAGRRALQSELRLLLLSENTQIVQSSEPGRDVGRPP